MEWCNDSVLQLINAYRIRPVLWNSSDPYYKNKNKKEDAWGEIADMMKTDSAEIKKKIQSLLASFRREKQKLKTTSGMGAEEVYDTKWFAFKSLLFLKDKNRPVQTEDTEGKVSKIITEFILYLIIIIKNIKLLGLYSSQKSFIISTNIILAMALFL